MILIQDNWGHTNFPMGFTKGSGRVVFNMGGVKWYGTMARSSKGNGSRENWRALVELCTLLVTYIQVNFTRIKNTVRYT